jgi:protein gp37
MSQKTIIAWTDHTFNIAWGCQKVSPGCANCYADGLAARYGHDVWGPQKPRRTFGSKHWAEPRKWDQDAARAGKVARVFCSSMCDVFEDHPTITAERAKLWPLIEATPNLAWQLLTKRPERIAANLPANWDRIRQRVWIGCSVENADYVGRIDHIRTIDAAVRFVSYEPALGPIAHAANLCGIDWLIYGGESGPRYRPEDKQWARDIMALCRETGTAFFHKQSAALYTERGIKLDGVLVREYPTPRVALPVVD